MTRKLNLDFYFIVLEFAAFLLMKLKVYKNIYKSTDRNDSNLYE